MDSINISKITSLSIKLKNNHKNYKSIDDVYHVLRKNMLISELMNSNILSPKEFIYLIFLICLQNNGIKIDDIIKLLTNYLFTFRIFFISEENSIVECETCNGNADTLCDECYGNGDDDEGNVCFVCKGRGRLECSTCDGDGEVELEGYQEVDIKEYISINSKLRYKLFELYDDSKVSDSFMNMLNSDNLTLLSNEYYKNISLYKKDFNQNDYIFNSMNENPKFALSINNIIKVI
jgi:hypothetical protein